MEDVQAVFDIVSTAITTLAVIVGALWAYFKFVKGRTFRPRLEVGLRGQWRIIDGQQWLQAQVSVKNIGASVVRLLQPGTGLRISALSEEQETAPADASWESLRVFSILEDHEWIEPGETVADDLLLHVGPNIPVPTRFDARLVWNWHRGKGNIVVKARRVVPVDSRLDGDAMAQQPASIHAARSSDARDG
jgi:hypothetical protein